MAEATATSTYSGQLQLPRRSPIQIKHRATLQMTPDLEAVDHSRLGASHTLIHHRTPVELLQLQLIIVRRWTSEAVLCHRRRIILQLSLSHLLRAECRSRVPLKVLPGLHVLVCRLRHQCDATDRATPALPVPLPGNRSRTIQRLSSRIRVSRALWRVLHHVGAVY